MNFRMILGKLFFPNGIKRAEVIQMRERTANIPPGGVLPNPNPKVPASHVPVVKVLPKPPVGPVSGGKVSIPPLGRYAFRAGQEAAPQNEPIPTTTAIPQRTSIPFRGVY